MARQRPMQRPWQEPDSARFATLGQAASEHGQIPGIATALGRQHPTSSDHRLPPLATSCDQYDLRPQDGVKASADLGSVKSSQPSSPLISPSARPGKRARWHWSQESTPVLGARVDDHRHVSVLGQDGSSRAALTDSACIAGRRPEQGNPSSKFQSRERSSLLSTGKCLFQLCKHRPSCGEACVRTAYPRRQDQKCLGALQSIPERKITAFQAAQCFSSADMVAEHEHGYYKSRP